MGSPDNDLIEISDATKLNTSPSVSVHMLAYNHEKYISKAIEGVVSQKADFPFELIIGDDCSTDNTRNIALDYQKRYPETIRVVYSDKNVGPFNNFYRVYKLCRGQYIAMCEGDDSWVDPEKLSKQVDFLNRHPDYSATYHDFIACFDGDINNVSDIKSHVYDTTEKQLTLGGGGFQHSTICFRNILGDLPEEFSKVTGGDLFLRSLLGNHGKGKHIKDISPGIYNIHPGGLWSGSNQTEQLIKSVSTRCWIASYYKRVNNPYIAAQFACNALTRIVKVMVSNKPVLLQWFLKTFFENFYSYYKRLGRMLNR